MSETYLVRPHGCDPFPARSLVEALHGVAARLGDRVALRFKCDGLWQSLTWSAFRDAVSVCAADLITAGVQPGDRVGILSENRVEWLIADLGILSAGAVSVPVHAGLPAATVTEQFAHAEVSWLFVSDAGQRAKVADLPARLPGFRGMTVLADVVVHPDASAVAWAARYPLHGRAEPAADRLATILYTSGTTGEPKGVTLTHGNILSNALATVQVLPFAPGGTVLNWLPLSHVYARTSDFFMSVLTGTTLALAQSPETVRDDLVAIRPTNMHGVPRLYEKLLRDCGDGDAASAPDRPGSVAERLREVFGPQVDWVKAGGAPLPPRVAEAYREAGVTLLQGYGMTECAPVIATARKGANRLGTVGLPIPGVETRIAPDGELLVRGLNTTPGYWKDPAATAELLRDGWLHTGDLARFDDGYLVITGRKKDMIVLSTGKKVEPAGLELLLQADPRIEQAVVCGDGRPYLTALIVPRGAASRADLARGIDRALARVAPWERVGRFAVLLRPLSVAEGELTVSLKLRRPAVLERWREVIEGMYREG